MKSDLRSRAFNHIVIDQHRGILTKTSDYKQKLIREIEWYLKLPKDIKYIIPRIFSYSLDEDNPYVSMEYYAYPTLSKLFLYGNIGRVHWLQIFKGVRFIIEDMQRYVANDDFILDSLEYMYITKTASRLELLKTSGIIDFFKPFVINGKSYIPLANIIERLPLLIRKTLFNIGKFTIIHGDLCFTNILTDLNYSFVKCIDPRGSFGKYDIYGDSRYEIAKLLHSVEGKYDYIVENLYSANFGKNEINYKLNETPNQRDVFEIFYDTFKEYIVGKETEIKLIESLLFLSMASLHSENKTHQALILAVGLELLGEIINIRM